MTEIRPLRNDELTAFFQLVCNAFHIEKRDAFGNLRRDPVRAERTNWGLFAGGRLVSGLTTLPLRFGHGPAIGISNVATEAQERRRGYALALLRHVVAHAHEQGQGPALLFAHQVDLYERAGFELVDEIVRGRLDSTPPVRDETSEAAWIERRYQAWCDADPARLWRDDARWDRWYQRHGRCVPAGAEGYLRIEGSVARELVWAHPVPTLSVYGTVEYSGFASMIRNMEIPVHSPRRELFVLAHRFSFRPQMFMTDQF